MDSNIIRRVIILGVFSTIAILGFQSYWVVNTWNINEEEFNQKVNLALLNVASALAELNQSDLPTTDIIKRRTTNYYLVNIEDEIDANSLEYYLQKEMEAMALNIDFEYGVYDCSTNNMVYGNYVSFNPNGEVTLEKSDLPKYRDFTYYFGVRFPTRSGFLLGKMQLSIFFSIIMMVTVLFFAYSMFVILRQKRLSEMQKDFINNMTHEFKTPISTIKISSDVLLKHPLIKQDARLLQYTGIIKDQNLRLNKQVEKVLQLATIEGGNFHLKKERVNLNGLIEQVVGGLSLQMEKKEGAIKLELPEGSIWIDADRLHLNNILHNLLDNAIKYCKEYPVIFVSLKEARQKRTLTIQDKGIGIPQEYINRVFDKFFRIPTGNIHNVKGFGLGLFYVKNICEAHGWKISIESEEGAGTTINIEI